jgi:hypothetical protein
VKQLEELLANIQAIRHPVILAGDMNTSTQDATPRTVAGTIKKRLGDETFWASQGLRYATGVGVPISMLMGASLDGARFGRTMSDPTVFNIPVLAPNPEAKFFDTLEEFRFSDGGVFDFRGEEARAMKKGTLGNSNERSTKGFATTFEVTDGLGPAAKYKLDWIFVKPPGLNDPRDQFQPHRFAPHFGRTLTDLTEGPKNRISDHSPLIVDLPLREPPSIVRMSQPRPAQ